MSQTLNSKIAVIGIDIGKNSFHIVAQDRRGALVLRQKWSRGQMEARLDLAWSATTPRVDIVRLSRHWMRRPRKRDSDRETV